MNTGKVQIACLLETRLLQRDTDTLIRNAQVFDGNNTPSQYLDVLIKDDKIHAIAAPGELAASNIIEADGLALAPGFIDVHTHDDIEVIRNPEMLNKTSQGVTTVIAGNCGISATPIKVSDTAPDPINLLGEPDEFVFPQLNDYIRAVNKAAPNVNVASLVGHTSLRAQTMSCLHREANTDEIKAMQGMLQQALEQGALGLSTGLAYKNAFAANSEEVEALANLLPAFNGIYSTHLRTEFDGIIDALDEAFTLGKKVGVPVVISHLKCAGKDNWGRSEEVLEHLTKAQEHQHIGCDCYPYNASSSTLDLKQVTKDFEIDITWSDPHPEMAGKTLQEIAEQWSTTMEDAAKKLQPAGAVYHGMAEQDVQRFLSFAGSMIGSDGLPCDPSPHPRLWGSFPRVLGHYVREQNLMPLEQAIHKMTGLSANEFSLYKRGQIKTGYYADLVLFDPAKVKDNASFIDPKQRSAGIVKVWVNGKPTYQSDEQNFHLYRSRAGRFLKHNQRRSQA